MNDRIFEFIPFPAYRGKNSPGLKDEGQLGKDLKIETYREVQGINHPAQRLSEFLPTDMIKCGSEYWNSPANIVPHLDPNFRHRTYGDYWHSDTGRLPNKWKRFVDREDMGELFVFFFATLAILPEERTFKEYSAQQKKDCGDYLIGVMKIARVVEIHNSNWVAALEAHPDMRDQLVHNFHYRENEERKDPVVVVAGDETRGSTFIAPKAEPLRIRIGKKWRVEELGKQLFLTDKAPLRGIAYLYDIDFARRILRTLRNS